jgi:hypothetical protein
MQVLELEKRIESEKLRKALDSFVEAIICSLCVLVAVNVSIHYVFGAETTQLLKQLLLYVRVQGHHVYKP